MAQAIQIDLQKPSKLVEEGKVGEAVCKILMLEVGPSVAESSGPFWHVHLQQVNELTLQCQYLKYLLSSSKSLCPFDVYEMSHGAGCSKIAGIHQT